MNKKLSSYQKLKQEISRLKAENNVLLDNKDQAAIAGMRMLHQAKKDIKKAVWFGDSSVTGMGGINALINKE